MAERSVVYERGGSAPIRAALVARAGEVALFSKSDTKRIIVAALRAGGEYYRANFLPQLFTGRVYRAPFNYQITEKYRRKKAKAGETRPLVSIRDDHEHLIEAASNKSYVTVDVNGDKAMIAIHVPWDVGNQNRKVVGVMQALPAEWLADIARVVASTMDVLISGGQQMTRGGMALSTETRKAIGSTNARRKYADHIPRGVPGG